MDKIYCSNCGQLIPEDSNFCRYCGAPQHGQESALYRAQAPVIEQATVPSPGVPAVAAQVEVLPTAHETVPRRHLAPAAKWLFFINYIFRTSILIPFFAVGVYLEPLVLMLFGAYLLMVYLIATLVYNHFYFSVNIHNFEKEHGIIHKTHVGLPFIQVQNVNIVRSLIDRLLGIARLDIETAGSSRTKKRDIVGGARSKAEAHLPGLSLQDARFLHDLLLERAMMERGELRPGNHLPPSR